MVFIIDFMFIFLFIFIIFFLIVFIIILFFVQHVPFHHFIFLSEFFFFKGFPIQINSYIFS